MFRLASVEFSKCAARAKVQASNLATSGCLLASKFQALLAQGLVSLKVKVEHWQDCRVSRYFTEANYRKASKYTVGGKQQKVGYLYDCLLPWQQSAIYSYEWKRNPGCVANLHCECQELKPKVETNSPFLVSRPSSGVNTVNTVGSHLNYHYNVHVSTAKILLTINH